MACRPECVAEITPMVFPDGCNITKRTDSIDRMGYQKCTSPFEDVSEGGITDIDAWETKITAGDIVMTGSLLAEKAKGSVTKQRLSGCGPEEVVSRQQSITGRDYNTDPETLTEFAFYNSIMNNYRNLDLLVLTCGDLVRVYPAGTWAPEVDDVVPQTTEEANYMDFTVNITTSDMVVPISVPGLSTTI